MKTILVIFLYCVIRVHGYNDTIEKKTESAGCPSADVLLQRISTSLDYVSYLFWREDTKSLLVSDHYEDTMHEWYYKNSKIDATYLPGLNGETLAFYIPLKNDDKKAIVGAGEILREATISDDGVTMSPPVVVLEEDGYNMHTAHCDANGLLYIVSRYNLISNDPKKGSILYRVKNKVPEKVIQFDSVVADFVYSNDNKNIFVICHFGKTIVRYDFDIDAGKLSNPEIVFNITEYEFRWTMTAIDIDNKNNLWMTADAYVLKINDKFELIKIVETPFHGLTSMTFGGYKNKNLIVGGKKSCSGNEIQAGSLLLITGFDAVGHPDSLVVW